MTAPADFRVTVRDKTDRIKTRYVAHDEVYANRFAAAMQAATASRGHRVTVEPFTTEVTG